MQSGTESAASLEAPRPAAVRYVKGCNANLMQLRNEREITAIISSHWGSNVISRNSTSTKTKAESNGIAEKKLEDG